MKQEDDFFAELDKLNSSSNNKDGTEQKVDNLDNSTVDDTVDENSEDLFTSLDDNIEPSSGIQSSTDGEEEEEGEDSEGTEVLNWFKTNNIFDIDEDELKETTPDKVLDFIEDKLDNLIGDRVKDVIAELPEDLKLAVKYSIEGGNYQEILQSSNVNLVTQDTSTEEGQIKFMKELLKREGKTNVEIEAEVDYLIDKGKLKDLVRVKKEKIVSEDEDRKRELVREAEKNRLEDIKKQREFKDSIRSVISNSKNIGGYPLDKKTASNIPSYISDKVVKLENGAAITQLQKDIFYEVLQNKVASSQLAALMLNRNEDGTFNFEELIKEGSSEEAKKMKDDMRRKSNKQINTSINKKGRSNSNRMLADLFS